MTAFSASLTNLMALTPQSHDCSYYASRPIMAPPPLWLQRHADLRAHDFAHSADLWHQPRLADVTYAWSCRLCGINPAVPVAPYLHLLWRASSGLAGMSLPQPRYHLRTPYSLATLRKGFIWTICNAACVYVIFESVGRYSLNWGPNRRMKSDNKGTSL
jgi:hypothetical protein